MTKQVIGNVFFFSKKNKKNDEANEEEIQTQKNNLLCRFVFDGAGRKIGESISMDDDIIIIKSGKEFLGVPLKHIEEKEKTLLVKGLVDYSKSIELGEQWRQESLREIDQMGEDEGEEDES